MVTENQEQELFPVAPITSHLLAVIQTIEGVWERKISEFSTVKDRRLFHSACVEVRDSIEAQINNLPYENPKRIPRDICLTRQAPEPSTEGEQ